MIPKVLTIAGSDSSGGAGIQADLKTMSAYKMYGMTVLTALTAQNTTGVFSILDVDKSFIEAQIDAIFSDIRPDSVKIGMVSSSEAITVIAQKLIAYNAKHIVVDPVMVSTSGCELITKEAQKTLVQKLLPIAQVITPNIPEAEKLCGFSIKNTTDMEKAAHAIRELFVDSEHCPAVLVKGGHLIEDAQDFLLTKTGGRWISTKRVETNNTHGTGCTLSSAIACGLADGQSLLDAVKRAKTYLFGALSANLNLGSGSGPLLHSWE